MSDAAKLAAAGLTLGCFGGWLLGRSLAAVAYGVTATDLPSWGIVCGALAANLLAAAWRPAVEATRVDPVALLRQE
jgi:hypothetical protein